MQATARCAGRPVSTNEAITGESREKIMEVVERFRSGEAVFLVVYEDKTTGKTSTHISHESLIRQWARLGAWVEREADDRSTYVRIRDGAIRHSEKER